MRYRNCLCVRMVQVAVICLPFVAAAWEHHPPITAPVISTIPEIGGAFPATATSLESFLMATEADLASLLADEESWARAHLSSYKACPDVLAFHAMGTANDIRERFFKAIRVNPTIKTPLYLSPLGDDAAKSNGSLDPSDVSILRDTSNLSVFDFVPLAEGELAGVADIVAAASNEPDLGMDIGLFEDNNTDFGQYYGFGVQPFGNPGLDYGSQAPFHMGFYHESPIVFLFASFLKESYPEYRIHLFKSLSEFAFAHGQDYWGWRFMGWGLHYLCDLSMPYHTTALPGYGTLKMLWINLLDMIGWSKPKDDAVQLSSNRHVALETFEGIVMVNDTLNHDTQDPPLAVLLASRTIPAYSDTVPRDQIAKASHDMSGEMDKALSEYMPSHFVNDPQIELGDLPSRYQVVELIEAAHGAEAVAKLKELQAKAFVPFAVYGRSYVTAVLNLGGEAKTVGPAVNWRTAPFTAFLSLLARGAL